MKSGVYKITIGKYYYFGSTSDFKRRKWAHISELRYGTHRNRFMQRAWIKVRTFEFHILFRCPIDAAILKEQELIDAHISERNCVNLSTNASQPFLCPRNALQTAKRNRERIWTDESRRKLAEKAIGIKVDKSVFLARNAKYTGSGNPNAKLSARDITKILRLRARGETIMFLALLYSVNRTTIQRVCARAGVTYRPKTWSDAMRMAQREATSRNPKRYSRDVSGDKNPRHIAKYGRITDGVSSSKSSTPESLFA